MHEESIGKSWEDAEEENPSNIESQKENIDKVDYTLCCLYNEQDKKCGPYIRHRSAKSGLVSVEDLNADIENHFRNLCFKDSLEILRWSERKLIENRLGRELENRSVICKNNQNLYGVGWHKVKHCLHPLHSPYKKGTKTSATNLAPLWLVEELNDSTPFSFPVGGRICRLHLPPNPKQKKRRKIDVVEDIAMTEDVDEGANEDVENLDETYEPEHLQIAEDIQSHSAETSHQLTGILDISAIKFQIVKSLVHEISTSTKRLLRKKLMQVQEEAVKCVAECIAPTQGNELITELLNNSGNTSDEDDIPSDIVPLLNAYVESDAQGKLIILSLVDHCAHSKTDIQKLFGCTRYDVDKARKLRASSKGLVVPTKAKVKRNRLNISKCEHFLEFLFSSGLVQDVAYGVSKIHFDSGSVQTIPNAILTTKYSHAIAFYMEICRKCAYEPLSESALWRILRSLKPSKRKCLAGLDDITATGMNGFSHLTQFLSDRKRYKSLSDRLEKGKRYLKTSYQSHCSMESEIASHNSIYALSTPEEEPCVMIGESVCSECYNLVLTLEEILEIAKSEGIDDVIYDINTYINAIVTYMKHQMRDQQQRKAKAYCFDNLNDETGFWLKDFAQKVLPVRYREGQREYFGKKGMSMHIDVFFRKEEEDLLKYVYLTCLFRCKQSAVDVLNIGDNVLQTFKDNCPMILKMYAKSDNAGCYHGNYIFEALYKMCQRRGINLLRYDFNEPCKGKDQCDRESAGAKTVINSYVNSGHDVLNAEAVFDALHYGSGIKNTKVAVLESNHDESTLVGTEIKDVSKFHSVIFHDMYMKLYKYYNIGPGVKVDYAGSEFTPSYNVVKDFSHTQESVHSESRDKKKKKKKRNDHLSCNFIFCQNSLCSDVFETQEEYEQHLLSEKHTITQRHSSMDMIKASYIEKIKKLPHIYIQHWVQQIAIKQK